MTVPRILAVIVSILFSAGLQAQFLQNASFEDKAGAGIVPTGWTSCLPAHAPDTHDGSGILKVTNRPSKGKTYLGLKAHSTPGEINNNITEGVTTVLLSTLQPRDCYHFSIDLSYSDDMTFEGFPYNGPAILNIYSSSCGGALLWSSPAIDHTAWKKYSFSVNPDLPITDLTLEIGFLGEPQAGNILIDNMNIEGVEVDLGEDKFICNDIKTRLTVDIPGAHVLWSTGSISSSISVSETARYWAEVKYKDCVVRDSVLIVYPDPLKSSFANDTTLCPGDSIDVDDGTIGLVYRWSDGAFGPKRSIDLEGHYDVRVSNGCEQIHDSFFIDLDESKCCHVSAPNIFTPNADHLNDTFFLTADSEVAEFDLKIFNRWGHQVFETSSMNEAWNGYSNNRESSEGEYFWVVNLTCRNNNILWSNQLKGIVTLKR
jgi:gliding motility-associated-like protein